MSGEEHKKGRVSELEGQQQASGRAMFLLSGPQREGGKGGKQGVREREDEWISLFFSWFAREMVRAECFGHPAPTSLPLLLFFLRRPIHWSAGCRCHVILARKENRGGGGRERGGGGGV